MKKKLTSFIFTIVLMLSLALNAFAFTSSVYDIESNINKLNQIINCDFKGYINKTELIGEALNQFDMITFQYKNEIIIEQNKMRNIINQVEVLNNSSDISNSEKDMQISKLYQEADTILYGIDSKTIQYVFSVRKVMPTITYQRFSKKLKDFYNDINLTNNKLLTK